MKSQRAEHGAPQGSRYIAAAIAALIAASTAAANDPPPMEPPGKTVESIRTWVLERNPELRAMTLEAEAAAAKPRAAGALPDPMVTIEMEEISRERPRFEPNEVGQTLYGIRQRFPFWGKRGFARDAALADSRAALGERDAVALSVLANAERAYVEYWYTARATEVVERLLGFVGNMEALARARYGTGLAPMQDSLKAQVELTVMQRELIELAAMRADAAAMLNATLGRGPRDPLAEPVDKPDVAMALDYDALLARIESHPAVRAAQEAAKAAEARRRLTYRMRYPDLTVGVAPVQMEDRVDTWDLMLEFEIPLQQGTRRAEEHEARAMEAAALARLEAVRTELRGEVGSRWAQWQSARQQLQLVESTLLPQSEANYRSAVASYRVGAVDFTTLLEALRQWRAAELSRHGAARDVLARAAALRALAGSWSE